MIEIGLTASARTTAFKSAVIAGGMMLIASVVSAQEEKLPTTASVENLSNDRVDYFVVDLSVDHMLRMLGSDQGIRFDVTDRVIGRVQNQRLTGASEDILDVLASRYALDWFSFNGIYYVSSRGEALTRLVRLGRMSNGRALGALTDAGLDPNRFPSQPTADGTALALSGPPKYLGIAEAIIDSVPDETVSVSPPRRLPPVRRANYLYSQQLTTTPEQTIAPEQTILEDDN